MTTAWGMSYEDWEQTPGAATGERVREAITYERMGWPMPISGDLRAGRVEDE